MGQLIYDSQPLELRLDDRALTHLQIVIVNLIRRGESFVFSWKDDPAVGGAAAASGSTRTVDCTSSSPAASPRA